MDGLKGGSDGEYKDNESDYVVDDIDTPDTTVVAEPNQEILSESNENIIEEISEEEIADPQSLLGDLDPADRLPSAQGEEDTLDIPAFLRRQAN